MQVVTVGKFQGGGAFNVIPDSVTIGGTFRAFSKESFIQLKQRIEEVIVLNATDSEVLYAMFGSLEGEESRGEWLSSTLFGCF